MTDASHQEQPPKTPEERGLECAAFYAASGAAKGKAEYVDHPTSETLGHVRFTSPDGRPLFLVKVMRDELLGGGDRDEQLAARVAVTRRWPQCFAALEHHEETGCLFQPWVHGYPPQRQHVDPYFHALDEIGAAPHVTNVSYANCVRTNAGVVCVDFAVLDPAKYRAEFPTE